jgi:hypothetical protein
MRGPLRTEVMQAWNKQGNILWHTVGRQFLELISRGWVVEAGSRNRIFQASRDQCMPVTNGCGMEGGQAWKEQNQVGTSSFFVTLDNFLPS